MARKTTNQILAELDDEISWYEHDMPHGGGDRSVGVGMRRGGAIAASWDARAKNVRDHVIGLVRESPQVMVKITGSNADMKGLARSLDYVARGGKYKSKGKEELEVENENGDIFTGVDGRELLRREWSLGGPPIPDLAETVGFIDGKKPQREVLKIIYSMPAEVGREAVSNAARAAIKETFKGHQWVIAHHADTDNQHTHLLVKMVGLNGKRMNPRKADLEGWRKAFARELNARGVEAVSTRRRVRFKRTKGVSQAVRGLRDRGITPERDKTSMPQSKAVERAKANEERMIKAYSGIAQALADSQNVLDRELSQKLTSHLAKQGHTINLSMGGAAPKPSV